MWSLRILSTRYPIQYGAWGKSLDKFDILFGRAFQFSWLGPIRTLTLRFGRTPEIPFDNQLATYTHFGTLQCVQLKWYVRLWDSLFLFHFDRLADLLLEYPHIQVAFHIYRINNLIRTPSIPFGVDTFFATC